MTINNCSELLTRIQSQISGISSTQSAKEITLLAAAVAQATDNRQVSVASSSSLPNIKSNNISNGQMIFLEDRLIPVIANNECWLGLDGRVLRSDAPTRTLFTWGLNGFAARLGDGTTVDRCSPGTVAGGGTNWCQFSSNYSQGAAIKTDGTLWTWGENYFGILGNGTTVSRSSPGTIVGGGTTWCLVSAGRCVISAIKTDGTLWTWGSNSQGVLGDGTILNRCSPGTVAGGGTTWCQVSAGILRVAAIKTDGTLWTWGCNNQGRLGDGTTVNRSSPVTVAGGGTNWCQVSAICGHSAAIKTDGTLWTWGLNLQGQLGTGGSASRSSPGTVAGGGTNWCQVSTTRCHSSAIKTDGTLWTWGYNGQGQLGNGTSFIRVSPGTVVGGGTIWCQTAAGATETKAIKTDGTLWTWGSGSCGTLGNGITTDRCSPGTIVGGINTWCSLSGSGYATGAISVQ